MKIRGRPTALAYPVAGWRTCNRTSWRSASRSVGRRAARSSARTGGSAGSSAAGTRRLRPRARRRVGARSVWAPNGGASTRVDTGRVGTTVRPPTTAVHHRPGREPRRGSPAGGPAQVESRPAYVVGLGGGQVHAVGPDLGHRRLSGPGVAGVYGEHAMPGQHGHLGHRLLLGEEASRAAGLIGGAQAAGQAGTAQQHGEQVPPAWRRTARPPAGADRGRRRRARCAGRPRTGATSRTAMVVCLPAGEADRDGQLVGHRGDVGPDPVGGPLLGVDPVLGVPAPGRAARGQHEQDGADRPPPAAGARQVPGRRRGRPLTAHAGQPGGGPGRRPPLAVHARDSQTQAGVGRGRPRTSRRVTGGSCGAGVRRPPR